MRLGKKLCLSVALVVFSVIALAQNKEQLYERGLSYLKEGNTENVKESYSLIKKSAEQGYVPAQAVLAYLVKNGIGTKKDLEEAWRWAQSAIAQGDGLAFWVGAQISDERGFDLNMINGYIFQAYEREYPFAKLLYAKGYAIGNADLGLNKDEAKSQRILEDLSTFGLPEALALLASQKLDNPQIAFPNLKKAADGGIPEAAAIVANMYYNGEGVPKSESEAFKYYEKAAEKKVHAGIEGLADCYRTGVGAGLFQERAFNLYKDLQDPSPRVMYILGCYFNEGISTAKDFSKAADLFGKSAAKGNVFAQAMLGLAHYDGSAPFDAKDFDKAYSYIKSALDNPELGNLPAEIAAKVYNYAARCVRFGRGGAVKDVNEADRLQAKADALGEDTGSQPLPFASIGLLPFSEAAKKYDFSWDSEVFENILDRVTFDYPKDYLDKVPEQTVVEQPKQVEVVQPEQEVPTVIPSEAKDLPNQQTVAPTPAPKTPKAKSPKSGRLSVMIEASPYCFAPTSVVSSRDGNTYWLKGSAIDVSASVGWLTNSGLFIGAGAGYESFSGGRMSVIQGFVDARYFLGGADNSGIFLGARGGVGMGSPEYGIGITAAGMLGYKIAIGGNIGINIGLKAGINSFTDDNKTMGNVVGPFVGISF